MNRYRVEQNIGATGMIYFSVMDYCVDKGTFPAHMGSFELFSSATARADHLNAQDGKAKAEWDQHHYPDTDDSAKHYLRHNGVTHVVHGTAAAMDAFRAINRMRIQRNQEMQRRVVASQDEIASLRKQVHDLRNQRDNHMCNTAGAAVYPFEASSGQTLRETGPQLVARVYRQRELIESLNASVNEFRAQRDSHVCGTEWLGAYHAAASKLESLRVSLLELAAR